MQTNYFKLNFFLHWTITVCIILAFISKYESNELDCFIYCILVYTIWCCVLLFHDYAWGNLII